MLIAHQFAGLWKYIQDWQNVFRHFDRDRSGSIDGAELSEALRSFGYNLSPTLLSLLEQKYGTSQSCHMSRDDSSVRSISKVASGPSDRYGPPPGITFDRFVRACVVVKTLTDAFQRYVQTHVSLMLAEIHDLALALTPTVTDGCK